MMLWGSKAEIRHFDVMRRERRVNYKTSFRIRTKSLRVRVCSVCEEEEDRKTDVSLGSVVFSDLNAEDFVKGNKLSL